MTSVAELLTTTRDMDEDTFVMQHPATALVVEPFAITAASPPMTKRLDRLGIFENPLLQPETKPHSSAPIDDEHETMVIRLSDLPRKKAATWRRSPQGFLHPDAQVVWLVSGRSQQIPGVLAAGRSRLGADEIG